MFRKKSVGISISLFLALSISLLFSACSNKPASNPTVTVSQTTISAASAVPSGGGSLTGTLTANYLNVGQGDSEFVQLPSGQTMLIDAGNPGDGSGIVQYIKDKGFAKIDYLIATHPHADHIGGMADVIKGIDIGSIYMPKVADTTKTYEELLNTIKSKGLTVNTAKAGVKLIDGPDLKVIMIAPVSSKNEDLNNYSAVIKITYKGTSFLFMGDAQTQSEDEIMKAGADVKADVLKVGHHGSDTSTSKAFLQAVSPKYAVISVGAGNDYGHPKQTTLDKLQKVGAQVYRTDQNGTIIITSDGSKISVSTSSFSSIAGKAESGVTASTPAPVVVPSTPEATPSSPAPAQASTDDKQSTIVYVTKTGKKYHRAGCSYLKGSAIQMTLADAEAKGYTPCSKCDPPS